MRREQKTILNLIIISMLAMVGSNQLLNIQSGTVITENGEDWSTYEPISDTNLNSSYYEILADSANNIHILFCVSDEIANYSLLVHEIRFNNGSEKTVNVVDVDGQSAYSNFVVDIDTSDRLHLIQFNSSGGYFVYYIGYQGSWEVKSVFEVETSDYSLIVDSSEKVHFIYNDNHDNLYDKIFSNNEWHEEEQITFYTLESETEYFSVYFSKAVKSIQGKIALLYGYRVYSHTPGVTGVFQLHCLIYDEQWFDPKIIAEYYPTAYDLAFDDAEKLHLLWPSSGIFNSIDYQTLKGKKWSEVKQITLFEIAEAGLGYYGFLYFDLEIKGSTILIVLSLTELLETAFDLDLFVAYSNDGATYTTVPICRNNETRSIYPKIAATTEGDVYVIAYENPIVGGYNWTINMGYYEGLFTYQTTTIPIEYLLLIFPVAIAVLVFKKKTRRIKT